MTVVFTPLSAGFRQRTEEPGTTLASGSSINICSDSNPTLYSVLPFSLPRIRWIDFGFFLMV